jgi:hypothetical protein
VDPSDDDPSGARFEMFDANEHFVVVRDDEGYGVWRYDDLEDGAALERFSDDDSGYERAAARWKDLTKTDRRERRSLHSALIAALKWVVIVSAAIWVLATALSGILIFETNNFPFDGGGLFAEMFKWSQIVSGVAQPLTMGGFAVYVILWLERRMAR